MLGVVVGEVPHQLGGDLAGGGQHHLLLRLNEAVTVPAVGAPDDLFNGDVRFGVEQVDGALAEHGSDVHWSLHMRRKASSHS